MTTEELAQILYPQRHISQLGSFEVERLKALEVAIEAHTAQKVREFYQRERRSIEVLVDDQGEWGQVRKNLLDDIDVIYKDIAHSGELERRPMSKEHTEQLPIGTVVITHNDDFELNGRYPKIPAETMLLRLVPGDLSPEPYWQRIDVIPATGAARNPNGRWAYNVFKGELVVPMSWLETSNKAFAKEVLEKVLESPHHPLKGSPMRKHIDQLIADLSAGKETHA